MNDRIPELQRKDAENQAIYDNIGVCGDYNYEGTCETTEYTYVRA